MYGQGVDNISGLDHGYYRMTHTPLGPLAVNDDIM